MLHKKALQLSPQGPVGQAKTFYSIIASKCNKENRHRSKRRLRKHFAKI